MFGRWARFVVRRPWWVIGGWLVGALLIIGFLPSLSDITTADQGSFLPNSYESVQAVNLVAGSLQGSYTNSYNFYYNCTNNTNVPATNNNTTQDPLLVNPYSDWHYPASSPARNAGMAVATIAGFNVAGLHRRGCRYRRRCRSGSPAVTMPAAIAAVGVDDVDRDFVADQVVAM